MGVVKFQQPPRKIAPNGFCPFLTDFLGASKGVALSGRRGERKGPMSVETWDKNEITKLAFASGKPLEIQCAEEFIKAGWNARLGSFFKDIFSDKTRELDVYIKKQQ